MKRILFFSLYVCIYPYAQTDAASSKRTDANIYGHVLDSKTGEHLPFVTIKLKGTTIGITTDHTAITSSATCRWEIHPGSLNDRLQTAGSAVMIKPNSTRN